MTSHVAGSEYVIEYVNYEVILIDEKYKVINYCNIIGYKLTWTYENKTFSWSNLYNQLSGLVT